MAIELPDNTASLNSFIGYLAHTQVSVLISDLYDASKETGCMWENCEKRNSHQLVDSQMIIKKYETQGRLSLKLLQ